MATGGPETALALGQLPDIDAAIAAGNAASAVADPNAVQAQPQQSTTTAAVDPTAPQQPQQMGGGLKFTTKPANFGGQRMNAQDFVPHPDPYSIQAYGQTFSQPAFNLPAPAIAARLQGLAQEQAELNKVTEEAFAQDKKPVVPAQYSRSYNNLYAQGEDELRKSVMEQYGGREDLAAKALAGKDPNNRAAHRAYLKFHKDMDDLGRVMTHNVDEAMLNIQQMKTGERPWDQASFDASNDLLRGFNELGQGGYGDVQKLTQIAQNYDRTTSLPYTLAQKDKNGMSLDEHIRNNMAASFTKNADGSPKFWVDKAGRFTVLTHEDLETAETILDGLTEELWPRFDAQYDSKEEFRARLGQLYPVKVELKVDDVHDPSAGNQRSTPADKVWIGRPDQAEGLVQTVDKDGVKRRVPRSTRISVGNVVDGRQEQFTKPASFKNGDKTVNMVWTGVETADDGSVVLVGIDPGDVTTNSEADEIRTEIGDLDSRIRDEAKYEPLQSWYKDDKDGAKFKEAYDKWATTMKENKDRRSELLRKQSTTQKSKGEKTVPLKGNEGLADGLLGGRLQQAIGQLGGTRKESKPFIDPTKAQAKTTADPLGIL